MREACRSSVYRPSVMVQEIAGGPRVPTRASPSDDWKTLSVNQQLMDTSFEFGKDKAAKRKGTCSALYILSKDPAGL